MRSIRQDLLKESLVPEVTTARTIDVLYTTSSSLACSFMDFYSIGSITLKDEYVKAFKEQCSPCPAKVEKEEVNWFIQSMADLHKYRAFMH